jgi:CRISPR-associated endoribonuclease Cas6
MRVLVRLRANADIAYDSTYHHKLRGAIWRQLQDTSYAALHGDSEAVSFTFSNPFPVRDMTEGDEQKILIASPHNGLVETVAETIDRGETFNIGEMSFTVDGCATFGVDVGEPGTRGRLRTDTGVYVRLPREQWDEYGIDAEYNAEQISWTPDYPVGLFLQRVRENLAWKHNIILDDYLQNVTAETELFDGIEPQKTYSLRVPVSSGAGYEYTFIVTKWVFGYRVRNDDHRRWLNLLLNAGVGWRNSLGFGFVNKVSA